MRRLGLVLVLAFGACIEDYGAPPPPSYPIPGIEAGGEWQGKIGARDGLSLWTWVLLPDVVPPEGVPTLLWRSPYRAPSYNYDSWRYYFRFFTHRGYAFVFQDVRGRGFSQGTFDVLRHEIDDGQDTTHWIVRQPWS